MHYNQQPKWGMFIEGQIKYPPMRMLTFPLRIIPTVSICVCGIIDLWDGFPPTSHTDALAAQSSPLCAPPCQSEGLPGGTCRVCLCGACSDEIKSFGGRLAAIFPCVPNLCCVSRGAVSVSLTGHLFGQCCAGGQKQAHTVQNHNDFNAWLTAIPYRIYGERIIRIQIDQCK